MFDGWWKMEGFSKIKTAEMQKNKKMKPANGSAGITEEGESSYNMSTSLSKVSQSAITLSKAQAGNNVRALLRRVYREVSEEYAVFPEL